MNEIAELELERANPATLFSPGGLDTIIAAIEVEARSLVPDTSTTQGRKDIASNAAKVAKSKVAIDNLGKEYVAKLKELPRIVDAVRKDMRERLDALRDEVRRPLTEIEEAEKARVEAIQARIADISREPPHGASSDAIKERIEQVQAIDSDSQDLFGEFVPQASNAKAQALSLLSERFSAAKTAEELATAKSELARQKMEREIEQRAAEIARQAQETEARRRAQEEHESMLASHRAQRESMALLYEKKVEPARKEPEQMEQPILCSQIIEEATSDIAQIIGHDQAKELVEAIEMGFIRHVRITFPANED